MDRFITMPANERRQLCEVAGGAMGLRPASIEKDFWVCWTLRELFSLPDVGPRLTFKGGTSLAKAWKLIERFSEDIDVVIDRDFLGYGGDASPDAAPSRKKRSQKLDELRAACRQYIGDSLTPGAARAHYPDSRPRRCQWLVAGIRSR